MNPLTQTLQAYGRPVPLTFGVELEFLVYAVTGDNQDAYPGDNRWFDDLRLPPFDGARTSSPGARIAAILFTLSAAGLPTFYTGEDPAAITARMQQHVERHQQHGAVANVDDRFRAWIASIDMSVRDNGELPRPVSGTFAGAELASRVLSSTDFPGATAEIDLVCRTLRQNMRVRTNRTAGCHVHVARPRAECPEGIDLLTGKKVVTLVWMLEDYLFQLAAPWRRECASCAPIRRYANFVWFSKEDYTFHEEMDDHVPACIYNGNEDLRACFCVLWEASSDEALKYCLTRVDEEEAEEDKYLTRWISVWYNTKGSCHTMEFRILEGTLDPALITQWSRVCTALVGKAASLDAAEYKSFLQGLDTRIRQGRFDFEGMLTILGLSDAIEFWRQKRAIDRAPVDANASPFLPRLG